MNIYIKVIPPWKYFSIIYIPEYTCNEFNLTIVNLPTFRWVKKKNRDYSFSSVNNFNASCNWLSVSLLGLVKYSSDNSTSLVGVTPFSLIK